MSFFWCSEIDVSYRSVREGASFCWWQTKIKALLDLPNAMEFMSSEESDNNEDGSRGPPPRHIKPLRWERSRLKKIKAVLDASYETRMTKRQKRTAAKITREADKNLSDRPVPKNCPYGQDVSNKDLKQIAIVTATLATGSKVTQGTCVEMTFRHRTKFDGIVVSTWE